MPEMRNLLDRGDRRRRRVPVDQSLAGGAGHNGSKLGLRLTNLLRQSTPDAVEDRSIALSPKEGRPALGGSTIAGLF
jgi:hypothetical protein